MRDRRFTVDAQREAQIARCGRQVQWATVAWNTGEVFITVALGVAAGSLALIAFGLDSLVDVFTSLVVVWHMKPQPSEPSRPSRDRLALRLIAAAFGALAVYLLAASARSLALGEGARSSPVGIGYLAATAVVMFVLAGAKRRIGARLHSQPFLAEASMTFLDGCLAIGVLTALAVNTALHWWWADPVAAAAVAAVAGWEARVDWRTAAV